MNCPKCRARLDGSTAVCPSCGAPVLDVIVAAKVQDALAQKASDDAKQAAAAEKASERAMYQQVLEANAREPREPLRAAGPMLLRWLALLGGGWLLLGVLVHFFFFGLIDRSPAGLLCTAHCPGCSGPGRVYSWGYEGSWEEAKGQMGYAFLCAAPGVDPDTLSWMDVSGARNAELQPYLMNGFFTWAVEGVFVTVLGALAIVALRLPGRGSRLDAQKAALEQKLASLR